ncbi:MAG: hypothetical protein KC560_01070, partial [Myxococcales bacterium]|nr:hypothetical protein [Myxococcales bacterium]
ATGLGALVALQAVNAWGLWPALDPLRSPRPIAEAALALARPGERIGVFAHPPLTPGLAYYARGSTDLFVDLPDRDAVVAFLARGNAVVVSRERRLPRLEPLPPPLAGGVVATRGEVVVLAPAERQHRGQAPERERLSVPAD